MTTAKQQSDFLQRLRKHVDEHGNESVACQGIAIVTGIASEDVPEYLRDIHENVIAAGNWQLGHKPEFCSDCNQPLNAHNRINYAVAEGHIIVTRDERVCDRCTDVRIDRFKLQPNV